MAVSNAEQAWAVTSDIAGAVVSDIAGAIEAALAEARAPLEAEVERLTRERDEARDDSLRLHREKCDHMDRWIAAKVRLARAREALQFYADEWLRTAVDATPFEPTDLLWDDKGDRARAALADSEPAGRAALAAEGE